MRVVGGRHKGKRLEGPADKGLRPTSDRAREALFNILAGGRFGEGDRVWGARVLDAFAGSGALGIEALSRGAGEVAFLEKNPTALKLIERNLANLGKEGLGREKVRIIAADATNPPSAKATADLLFLDPPYGCNLAPLALEALLERGWIGNESLIIVEVAAKETFQPPSAFEHLDARKYGAAKMHFLELKKSS